MNYNKAILLLLILFMFFSCKKNDDNNNDQNNDENWIPVTYYLSAQDKALFDFYYSCKTIQFSDSLNNHLVFHTDSLYDFTTHLESDERNGEMLQIAYACETTYFPNYSFNLFLTAKPDSVVDLFVEFATGTYWTDQGNDYVLSNFYFNPKRPYDLDSINPWGDIVRYDFLDSITIQNKVFHNVFYSEHEIINTDIKQTMRCYYTNDKGVIAFKNLDGEFWIRD